MPIRRDEANFHDAIEEMMDLGGIASVLRMVVNICHEKSNDPNETIARQWMLRAKWVDAKLQQYERKWCRDR